MLSLDYSVLNSTSYSVPKSFLNLISRLAVHNSSNNAIWDVAYRSDTGGRERTFSELNIVAPFHTDSAFRVIPEKYFGLWTIRAASDGGNSTAINVEELILKAFRYVDKSLDPSEILSKINECKLLLKRIQLLEGASKSN